MGHHAVITSYSIHYTKLYDRILQQFVMLVGTPNLHHRWQEYRQGTRMIQTIVITSYSIHYTKLYDSRLRQFFLGSHTGWMLSHSPVPLLLLR